MRRVERQRGAERDERGRPGERLHEADDVPPVQQQAVQQGRQEAVSVQHGQPVEPAAVGQDAGQVAYETPSVHLPRRPRPLPEEEVGHERRERAHQKAAAAAEHGSREDADGRHRLEVGNGSEQHATRRRKSRQHHGRHDLAQRRARGLKAGEEHAHRREGHDHGEQRALLHLEVRAHAQHEGHGGERRHLEQREEARRRAGRRARHERSSRHSRENASSVGR